jgi:hypothetical protein
MANDSCGKRKENADLNPAGLAVFKALGHCFVGRAAVTEDPRKLRNLGNPPAINFFLALDGEVHGLSPAGNERNRIVCW